MELENVSDMVAGGPELAGAAGVRFLNAIAGQVNAAFTPSFVESIDDAELLVLVEQAEQVGRYIDSLKVGLAAGVISREALPRKFGHRNHHSLLRDRTRCSSKEVITRVQVAENLNRTNAAVTVAAAQAGAVTGEGLAGSAGLSGVDFEQGDSASTLTGVPGGLLAAKFTAGELDLEAAALIVQSVNKAAKLDAQIEAARITPGNADATNLEGNTDSAGAGSTSTAGFGAGAGAFGAGGFARGVEDKLVNIDTHTDQMRAFARNEVKELELKHALDSKARIKRQAAGRGFSFGSEEPDGLIPIYGKLVPEVASLLTTAFDAINNPHAKQVGFVPEGEADAYVGDQFVKRTAAQMRHDALETIVSFGLRNNETPILGGEAATLVVTTTLEDLKNFDGTATVTSPDGSPTVVDAGAARHAACVGSVLRVTLNEGAVVAMHSLERNFTRKMRRAILARDGGCVIPECTVPANWCEIHHVTEWAKGGPTSIDNGVTLCKFHHRNLDSHGWVVGIKNGVPTVKRRENWLLGGNSHKNRATKNWAPENSAHEDWSLANYRSGEGPPDNGPPGHKSQETNLSENRPPGNNLQGTNAPKNRPPEKMVRGRKVPETGPPKNNPPKNNSHKNRLSDSKLQTRKTSSTKLF